MPFPTAVTNIPIVNRLLPIAFLASSVLLGCATREKSPTAAPTEEVSKEPWQPPVVPVLSETVTPLPLWASTRPDFPWLPGEDTERSRSIGDVSDGWIVNAVAIPQPHDHIRRIESHVPRGLDYSTQEMIELVESAAAHVANAHPGSVLYLGNFSADGGGDIPYSVSHNSGRDADLAFYMLDAKGESAVPDELLSFDARGRAKSDGKRVTFDVKRNWKLIEGLVKAGADEIQFVFVSRPLKKKLLAEAERAKASAQVIATADKMLIQPGGALPHNDHFHIRLYCSESDVVSGCKNSGRKNDGFDGFTKARGKTISGARKLLGSADKEVRLAAVRRLDLLSATAAAGDLAQRLKDEDPRVRSAAARALSTMGLEESAVASRLEAEENANVLAELVWALGDYGTKSATKALTRVLDEERPLAFDDGSKADLRVFVADVLSVAEDTRPVPALIELTASSDQDVRFRANRALKMLTNQDPGARPKASLHKAWKAWWKSHGKKSRDAWLLAGFKRFGVKKISLRYVWELTYPVLEDDHLSFNAQRTLMRLAKRDAPSLEWAKTDANFYWRRWFERRCPRLGCPKVPPELTTLN